MNNTKTDSLAQASRAYGRLGLALLAVALLTITMQLLVGIGGQLLAQGGLPVANSVWFKWLGTFLPLYLIGFPVGFLIMRAVPAEVQTDKKLGGKDFWIFLLICFPMMYVGNIIGTLLSSVLSGGTAENSLMQYAFDASPLKILVMVVLAPLTEEFIFRKQLIDRSRRYGEKPAILFSALTFALFHMNLYQFFYAFGLGLVFAYVYVRTGRLRYSVIMHMVINFIGSVLAPLIFSSVDPEVISQIFGQTFSVVGMEEEVLLSLLPQIGILLLYTLCYLSLCVAGLVLLIFKAMKLVFVPSAEELPKGQRFRAVFGNVGVILFVLFCSAICVWQLL